MVDLRRSERVVFSGEHGIELAGIVDLPVSTPKAFAVFTHCFTCTKDLKVIVRISRGLAEKGYGVLRYDHSGLGNSSGQFSQSNFSTNRAELRSAQAFLADQYAAPQFLIGHSFGGACSLSLLQESASIQGAVSLAAPSDTSHLAELLLRMNPGIAQDGQGSVRIGGLDHQISQQMLDDFRAFDLAGILRRTTKPVLLFHSPEDETLGYEHALRLFQLLTYRGVDDPQPAPASLICLPQADHLLTKQSADLVFVAETIAAWFDRLLVGV